MKEIILTTEIPREKGFLYFCGTDEKGNLTIGRSEMARGRKKVEATPVEEDGNTDRRTEEELLA